MKDTSGGRTQSPRTWTLMPLGWRTTTYPSRVVVCLLLGPPRDLYRLRTSGLVLESVGEQVVVGPGTSCRYTGLGDRSVSCSQSHNETGDTVCPSSRSGSRLYFTGRVPRGFHFFPSVDSCYTTECGRGHEVRGLCVRGPTVVGTPRVSPLSQR